MMPDDLRMAADCCVRALTPHADEGWAAPTALDWDVRATVEHMVDVLGFYTLHLSARSLERLRVDVTCHPKAPNAEVLRLLAAEAEGLAWLAEHADPESRVFHFHGATDVSGVLALACSELLIHSDDAARGLQAEVLPPRELTRRVVDRLFPGAPQETDAWRVLRWATGRGSLQGHPDVGSTWTYETSPRSEGRQQGVPEPEVGVPESSATPREPR